MLTRGHDHQLRGKTVRGSVLPGRGGGGGGSKRWLNTGRHLLTVALSSSLHWFPVKCIAETRRSAPKRHKHELIFEGIEGRILVRDTIDARTCRDAGSRKCVVSVVIVVCYFCRNRRGERSTYQRAFQDDGDDNDVKPTRPSWAERDPGGGSTPFPTSSSRSPAKISNPGARSSIISTRFEKSWEFSDLIANLDAWIRTRNDWTSDGSREYYSNVRLW